MRIAAAHVPVETNSQSNSVPPVREHLHWVLEIQHPRVEQVAGMVSAAASFLSDHGIRDPGWLGDTGVVLTEALTNAIRHGCKDHPEGFVRAEILLKPDAVEFLISDPSDFAGKQPGISLPADPFQEHGRGRFLMQKLTEEMRHASVDGRHVLQLTKRPPGGDWHYSGAELERTLSDMTAELASSFEMISTLTGLGEWLAKAPETESFVHGALKKLCEVTHADVAYVRRESEAGLEVVQSFGVNPEACKKLIPLGEMTFFSENEVFQSGEELTLPNLPGSLDAQDPLAGFLKSAFLTPVSFQEKRTGILVLGRIHPGPFFDAGQLNIARLVAKYLGIVMELRELHRLREQEERASRDWEIAAQVQASLMPGKIPSPKGLSVYGTCRAARNVGGDFFEICELPSGDMVSVVADVMGKGLPAATFALVFRTNFKAVLSRVEDPAELFRELNALMFDDLSRLGVFITATCVWVSSDRKTFRYASAGHPLPLHFPQGELPATGAVSYPFGVERGTHYQCEEKPLNVGDLVVLYTDGVSETVSTAGEFFGVEGIEDFFARNRPSNSWEAVNSLLGELRDFSGRQPPADDKTVVCILKAPPPSR